LIERSPIEDEITSDESVTSVSDRFRAELEDSADARVAVVGKSVLVGNRAKEPVEQNLSWWERVRESVAQKPSIDPAEALLGDGTETIDVQGVFSNTAHFEHLRITDSLFLTAGRGAG
jgi:Fe-S cluster assembly ATPase SufC